MDFDEYNSRNWSRSYQENLDRFARQTGRDEYEITDEQCRRRDERNEYYRQMDGH